MKKVVSIDYDELQLLYTNLKAFEESNNDRLVVGTNIFESHSMSTYQVYSVYTKDELILKLMNNISDLRQSVRDLEMQNNSFKVKRGGYFKF